MKKALLVVSFGTSFPDVINKCIKPVENELHQKFEGYDLYRAFTSRIIVKKLRQNYHMEVDAPLNAMQKIADSGYEEMVVQPLHFLPGTEYHDLMEHIEQFAMQHTNLVIRFGDPLFYRNEDYIEIARAIIKCLPSIGPDEAVLLMGHGTEHFSNACYFALQDALDEINSGIYVAGLEAIPSLKRVISKMKNGMVRKVHLLPLMLVAGDHAQNDMAGPDDDSWKNQLTNEGFQVETYLIGLGENPHIRQFYIDKAISAQTISY